MYMVFNTLPFQFELQSIQLLHPICGLNNIPLQKKETYIYKMNKQSFRTPNNNRMPAFWKMLQMFIWKITDEGSK